MAVIPNLTTWTKTNPYKALGAFGVVFGIVVGAFAIWDHFHPTTPKVSVTVTPELPFRGAETTLTVTPNPATGPRNLVTSVKVTIKREVVALEGGILTFDDETCADDVNVKKNTSSSFTCQLPEAVVEAAVKEPVTKTVALTAQGSIEASADATIDLSPNRCLPPQPGLTAPLNMSALIARWEAADAAPPLVPCTAGTRSWALDSSAWTQLTEFTEQMFGSSYAHLTFTASDDPDDPLLSTIEIGVSDADVDDLEHVEAVVSAVFSPDEVEMDHLLDGNMNRSCTGGALYSVAQSKESGLTTVVAALCPIEASTPEG